jgi:uncharacterized protein (DUF1684 family)
VERETDTIERERMEKDLFFKRHPQSPIPYEEREGFSGLRYYPVRPEFVFVLELHEHSDKQRVAVSDNKGNTQEFIRWGKFRFEIKGRQVTLQAYKSDPQEEGLWVPFKDETSGKDTYGAGRYLDLGDSHRRPDGRWVLDFNQAYNPFCAYSENYVCPFIPPENWLGVAIDAGEKSYR